MAAAASWTRAAAGLGRGLVAVLGGSPAALLHPDHCRPLHLPGHHFHLDGLAGLTAGLTTAVVVGVAIHWTSASLDGCLAGPPALAGGAVCCASCTAAIHQTLTAGGGAEASLARGNEFIQLVAVDINTELHVVPQAWHHRSSQAWLVGRIVEPAE